MQVFFQIPKLSSQHVKIGLDVNPLTVCYIIDAVQIASPLFIEHILPLTANNFQGIRLVKHFARFSVYQNKTRKKTRKD